MDQKKEKDRAVDFALDQIQKQFGKGSIMRFSKEHAESIESIPTGSISLDLALGVGGLPRGRIIEIFGPEAAGKTMLSLHTIAQAQKRGGLAAFIDAEHAFNPEFAQRIGVILEDLLISQPDYGEQALEIVETLVRSSAVDVVVIDSVAALVPKAEIEGEMGESQIGLQARLMSQALRKLAGAIAKSKTMVIFINQMRMKIGIMFGNPETQPGGLALKFYSTVRLDVRRAEQIKEGEVVIGNRIRVKVVKNKVAPPFRTAEFDLLFDRGISYEGDLLETAVKEEIVSKTGAWYTYDNEKLAQGRQASAQYLVDNPKLVKELEKKVKEKVKEEEK